jgi:TatD DNase family protein
MSVELIDSHCHLHLMDLSAFPNQIQQVLDEAKEKGVGQVLCVSVDLEDYPKLCEMSKVFKQVFISVGVHPNHEMNVEPTAEHLAKLAQFPACVALGETGLDYYRIETEEEKARQLTRFVAHIHAAIATKKPLIIHTRQAATDTIAYLTNEKADRAGGVMHCFTESWEVAKAAMDLGFYISFSGIVTFKNALEIQDVAKKMPLDRILIETDTPYLAPTPFRGTQNQPAYVYRVAEMLAELRGETVEQVAQATTENFYRCFGISRPCHSI